MCVLRWRERFAALELLMFHSQKWREEESLNTGQCPQCLQILRGIVVYALPGSPRNAKNCQQDRRENLKDGFHLCLYYIFSIYIL